MTTIIYRSHKVETRGAAYAASVGAAVHEFETLPDAQAAVDAWIGAHRDAALVAALEAVQGGASSSVEVYRERGEVDMQMIDYALNELTREGVLRSPAPFAWELA
ncbi:hypothetical protein [Leucobacter triazinivorans]|uniref:Uncharacterized protein n=1 Tax=Leucobacter triazinivorans TaxID=1784719 RepID=A0A4P6KF23_9MICO|nr:hypothetical protein [Leucobacter triazinivorans]QBE48740.1 hypothetical protein EVS81_07775 [Leucobacter triazinivorans]